MNYSIGLADFLGKGWLPARVAFGLPLIFGIDTAIGQIRPDAGTVQQELERVRPLGLEPPAPSAPVIVGPGRPRLSAPKGKLFRVNGFRITRVTAFDKTVLLPLLATFVGKDLSLADLERAAEKITDFYRQRGYFVARAYVPAQDVAGGVVEITVLEGKLEAVRLKRATEIRLQEQLVNETVRASFSGDGLIRLDALEKGLLLLKDMPGIDVRSLLLPGTALGTSIVEVEVAEGPLVSGNIEIDNFGSKYTGPLRLGGAVSLNDPLGRGDQLNLRATTSAGTGFARLGYQVPVGRTGLKLGGAYSETRYRLCCEFAPLEAKGEAQATNLSAQYPFLRGRSANLQGSATFDAKRFFNATVAGTTSDKNAHVIGLGLSGDSSVHFGGNGLSSFGLNMYSGQLNLDGWAPDRAADAATARTHGSYFKTSYSVARLQPLSRNTSLYAGLSGQFASGNLDSSEKFVLGGPLGVRAYPIGEAAGDEGSLISLEIRHELRPALQLSGFVDHGTIRLHRDEWAGWQGTNTGIGNRYALSGAGVSLTWSQPGELAFRASVAQPLGDNPGRDINGNDSDGARSRLRLWLQLVKFL